MLAMVKRLWGGHRGATLVEFALILPVLLLMVAGLWEFGRIYDAYLVATNAAREGARWAALGEDQAAVQARVGDYLNSGYAGRLSTGELSVGTITMDLLTDPANGYVVAGAPGAPVRVRVPVTVLFYLPGVLGQGNSIGVLGDATMRLQYLSAQTPPPPGSSPTAVPTATATATATATPTATDTATPTKTPRPTKTPKP